MTDQPTFVDNREGNTLSSAINQYLNDLDAELIEEPDLDIVTGYFNPNGFHSLANGLEHVDQVRLLIGAQPEFEDGNRWRQPSDPLDEDEYRQQRIDTALQSLEEDLEQDRNLLGFSRTIDQRLQRLVDFLNEDRVEVRRHENKFIHGKAYMFNDDKGIIAGSSNFTGAGLNQNLELNLGHYSPHVTEQVQDWFEDLWAESESYNLASLYEERFEPYDPYLIYLRVLYERYGDELEAEREENDGAINLANFQQDGKRRAQRFLDERNGVIVADEVGLGKTYIGGQLLEETVQERRQRALVVAPAYLRDGMWKRVRSKWNFYFDVVSYSQLRNDRRLNPEGNSTSLDHPPEEYQMVVIDEAQAFRNPGTQQSQALRQLLRGTPQKDLVMLTATPVNNSLWDLYYLLKYFVKNDAEFASDGIRSLRERFKTAQSEDPSELNPEMLFDVLDQTTVRRTRRFIKEHYEKATLPDGEGNDVLIEFPEPHPSRIDYTFAETFGDEFFRNIAQGLAAEDDNDDPDLTLARYQPSKYLEGDEEASELSLVGLLRTGLLKRFESSSHAFANTLDRMIEQNQAALSLMDRGYFPQPDAIEEWVETDSDEAIDELFVEAEGGSAHKPLAAASKDPARLRADLENDLEILQHWRDGARAVSRGDDEKLHELKETLRDIIRDARHDAEDETLADDEMQIQFRKNRKVLLFSYYEDTVDWILDHLEDIVEDDDELSHYVGRIAAVSGSGSKKGISREEAVHGFAPHSSDAPKDAEDKYDILIATDVLGQGVNLQDARNVINYDLPWNPMRVVQRNGRIDRINSPHSEIYPFSFFPEDRLDELLELENRVRRKITQAARTIGEDGGIFPDMETVEQNFADQRENIDAIRSGDQQAYEQGGTQAAAYSGEEYRQELREGLEDSEERITSLPWAAGSGFRGANPGFFFCARIGEELFMRFVPLDADFENDDDPLIRDTLPCLKRIECRHTTDRVLPDETRDGLYDAWDKARKDIYEDWEYRTDPRNIAPDVPRILREVGDHLESHWPSDETQELLERTKESVQQPLSQREAREFREIYKADAYGPVEKSRRFVEKVEELGLEPFEAPGALPEVAENEVRLICWMAISPPRS